MGDDEDGDGGRGTLTGSEVSVVACSGAELDATTKLVVLLFRRGPCRNA